MEPTYATYYSVITTSIGSEIVVVIKLFLVINSCSVVINYYYESNGSGGAFRGVIITFRKGVLTIIFRPTLITFTSSGSSVRTIKVLTVSCCNQFRYFHAIRGSPHVRVKVNSATRRILTSIFRELIVHIFRNRGRVISTVLHNPSSFQSTVMHFVTYKSDSRHSFEVILTMTLISVIRRHHCKDVVIHVVSSNSNVQLHVIRVLRAANSACQFRVIRHFLHNNFVRVRSGNVHGNGNYNNVHVVRVTVRLRTRQSGLFTFRHGNRSTVINKFQPYNRVHNQYFTGDRHNSKGVNSYDVLAGGVNIYTYHTRGRKAAVLCSLAFTIRMVLRYQVLSKTSVIQTSVRRYNSIRDGSRGAVSFMHLQQGLRG